MERQWINVTICGDEGCGTCYRCLFNAVIRDCDSLRETLAEIAQKAILTSNKINRGELLNGIWRADI